MEGCVDKSYGINVAKLANLPNEVITRAKELLLKYETNSDNKKKVVKQFELNFEETKPDLLREYIKTINPYEVTPIEAINILNEIKIKSEKE